MHSHYVSNKFHSHINMEFIKIIHPLQSLYWTNIGTEDRQTDKNLKTVIYVSVVLQYTI